MPPGPAQKLEAVGVSQLKQALHLSADTPLDAATTSFTTTDVNAGICLTGCIIQKVCARQGAWAECVAQPAAEHAWAVDTQCAPLD